MVVVSIVSGTVTVLYYCRSVRVLSLMVLLLLGYMAVYVCIQCAVIVRMIVSRVGIVCLVGNDSRC